MLRGAPPGSRPCHLPFLLPSHLQVLCVHADAQRGHLSQCDSCNLNLCCGLQPGGVSQSSAPTIEPPKGNSSPAEEGDGQRRPQPPGPSAPRAGADTQCGTKRCAGGPTVWGRHCRQRGAGGAGAPAWGRGAGGAGERPESRRGRRSWSERGDSTPGRTCAGQEAGPAQPLLAAPAPHR